MNGLFAVRNVERDRLQISRKKRENTAADGNACAVTVVYDLSGENDVPLIIDLRRTEADEVFTRRSRNRCVEIRYSL